MARRSKLASRTDIFYLAVFCGGVTGLIFASLTVSLLSMLMPQTTYSSSPYSVANFILTALVALLLTGFIVPVMDLLKRVGFKQATVSAFELILLLGLVLGWFVVALNFQQHLSVDRQFLLDTSMLVVPGALYVAVTVVSRVLRSGKAAL